jgi:hypothetical protein
LIRGVAFGGRSLIRGRLEKFTKLKVLKFVKLNVFLDISLRIELTILSKNLFA